MIIHLGKRLVNKFLGIFKLRIMQQSSLETYQNIASEYQALFRSGEDAKFLLAMPTHALKNLLKNSKNSQSQIRQDLFVLAATNFKKSGYFVEFGATDGVSLNNTYLLEKEYGWRGVLAEPAKMWHESLLSNRSAIISKECVWSESGCEIEFVESEVPELSTALDLVNHDSHSSSRVISKRYRVKTISLNDLLTQCDAPNIIDYLSLDTEGSEYLILSNLDFAKWKFQVITVEHNFTQARAQIANLLTSNGYIQVCQDISLFDDWYLCEELAKICDFQTD